MKVLENSAHESASNGRGAALNGSPPPKRRGRPLKVRQARALLREQLAGGPRPGAQIEAAAQAAAIPKAALLAAADGLDVRCRRGEWRLPR